MKRCLIQLIKQSVDISFFEVIVVSDGPDRETQLLIDETVAKGVINLKFISSDVKMGPAHARNIGWLAAKGELIAFTDDDCMPDPDWLKAILDNYKGEKFIAYSGKTIVPISRRPHDFELNTGRLQDADFITANCACTKQALIRIGGFDVRFKLAWREDSDLEFKLIEQGIPIVTLHEARVVHPVRKCQWAVSVKEQKKVIYDALLFKKYPALYRRKIANGTAWNYYLILLFTLLSVYAVYKEMPYVAFVCLLLVVGFILSFTWKRLKYADKSLRHVAEMFITSVIIPYVAVYWKTYGAIKFRVMLL